MQKRGQLSLQAIASVLAAAIVILAFIQAGKAYGSQEVYFKQAVATDIALTIDLIYSLPGNIEYIYPQDISGFDVEIADNKVRALKGELGKTDPTFGYYSFAGVHQKLNIDINDKKFVKITKIGNQINLQGIDTFEYNNFKGGRSGGAGGGSEYP